MIMLTTATDSVLRNHRIPILFFVYLLTLFIEDYTGKLFTMYY